MEQLAQAVQQVKGDNVEIACVDQEYTGQNAVDQAASHGIDLLVVKHTEAKKGFVLLPRRWVVERSFGRAARFSRLAQDYKQLSATLAGLHYVAFVCLMLNKTVSLFASGL
jgi:transposase